MVHKLQIEELAPTSRLRSVASQFVACMSPYLLLLDLGMAVSFVTIALPDLLNANEGLSLNETEASWFSSLSFLTQPLGAVISGPLVDFFGRKKANFLVNIPMIAAWILMYFAWNVGTLFTASALVGLSIGIMEAPINSYVGEISEPSLRGALSTTTQFFQSLGVFMMYFLGTVVTWRQAALLCLIAPVTSMLSVFLVPETPVWLLVKGREKEALKSLCYLRGWTTPENVRKEFDELLVYSKKMQICVICYNTGDEKVQECPHKKMNFLTRFVLKFKYVMLCKETLRPLALLVLYFSFFVMSGLAPIKPNMVNISGALGMPVDGKTVALMVGVISFVTSFLVVGLIKVLGKRKIAITALLGSAICCVVISVYARSSLDKSVFSYNVETFPKETSYLPLVAFYMLTTFTGFGLPWVLLGEVFPFRSRASAQGFAAASCYVITFLAAKTLLNLEKAFHLWGSFAVYATFGFIGSLYLYFFLPETEGKSLQEIESFYNAELKTFANDPIINFFRKIHSKKSTSSS